MAKAPHVRRRAHLGLSFRLAVAIVYPFMRTMVRWRISGTERLTQADGGVIVAPNHTSWFDPLVVAFAIWSADRPPRFLAKEAVFRVPFVGRIVRNAGQIPVYRESADASSAIRGALAALDLGECVVVYPEGTMTRDPALWPMSGKTGAVRLALASGRPLFPMVHWGTQDVMRPYAKEFRILPRKQVTVVVGAPVDLAGLGGRPVDAQVLAEGTDRLMDAITALLAQVRDQPAPATRMEFIRFPDKPVAPRSGQEGR